MIKTNMLFTGGNKELLFFEIKNKLKRGFGYKKRGRVVFFSGKKKNPKKK